MDTIYRHFNEAIQDYESHKKPEYRKEASELALILLACKVLESGADVMGNNWLVSRIECKLNSAQDYIEMWRQTQKTEYRNIAKDDLRHVDVLVRLAKDQKFSSSVLQPLVARRDEFMGEVS